MNERITANHPVRVLLAKFQKSHFIFPVAFLNAASYSVLGLGMIFYLRDQFGASAGVIGLSTALQWGGYLAGNLALRPLTRILLPRYSLIIAGLTAAAMTIAITQAEHLNGAIAAFAGVGFAMAFFWPPIMGWLSVGAEGSRLNRRISRFNLSWSFGTIVGPFLAGLLTEMSPRLPLYVGAVGFAMVGLAALVASIFIESIRTDNHRDSPRNGATISDESTPLRFPSWVGIFGAYVVLGALVVVFPLFAREQLGIRESIIGSVLLIRGLASAVGYVLAGRTVVWHFKKVPVVVPITTLIGMTLILTFGRTLLIFSLVLPIIGLAIAGSYSVSVFHGVAGSTERTRRMGVHEALLTAGIVVGSLGGGALYQRAGVGLVFGACALLLAVVLAVQSVFMLKR